MTVWTEAFSSRDWMKTRGRATGRRFSHFLTANCLVLSLAGVSAFAQPSIDSFSVPNAVEEMGVVLATVSASGQNPLTYLWSFEPDPTGQAFFFNSATAAYTKTISATSVIFGVGNPGPNPPSPSLEGQQFTVKVSVSDGTDTVVRTKQVTVSGSNQRPIITLATTGMGTQANPRVSPQALSLTANQSFDPDGEPVRFAWRLGAVSGGQPCPRKVLVVFGKETDRPSMPLPLVTARPQNPMRVNFVYRVIDAMYFLEDDVLGFAAAQNGCTEGGFSSGTSVGVPFGCESVGNQPAVATAPATYTILKGLQGEIHVINAGDPDSTPGVPIDGQPAPPAVSFQWSVTNGLGLMVTDDLSGRTTPTVTFTAPQVDSDETIGLEVLVLDAAGCGTKYPIDLVVLNFRNDDPDIVLTYEVQGQNISGNASTGDILVTSPATIEFDASRSSDPDGDPITFSWRSSNENLTSGATLLSSNDAIATLTALQETSGSVTVTVTVSDHRGGQASRNLTFVFFEFDEAVPLALATAMQGGFPVNRPLGNGEEFYLDASDSTVPDGTQEEIDNLVFEWTQIAGTNAFAQGLDQKVVNVLVTDIMQEESLVFQVLVRNGSSLGSDVVQVPVRPQYIGGPDTGTSEVFFPITGFGPIGDGTSLETTLIIEDVGPEDVDDVTIEFYDGRGDPFDVGYRAASSSPQTVDIWDPETPFSILGHTSRIMEFVSATGQEISSGWARVRSCGRLRGSVRFQIVAGDGSLVQDVGIFAGNRGRRFQTPFRRKDEFAIAISNPGDSAALVDLFLFSNDAPDSSIEVVTQLIQPSGMQAFFLAERFPGDLPIDEGTLIVAVEGEAEVVVTGLITKDGFFISSQSISRIE